MKTQNKDNNFNEKEVDKLLVDCQRRCCICHKFCGFKMEVHHIKSKADGGDGNIENAIPLCFECHAEVALYNPKHPKGRKYTENELKEHKKYWLNICKNEPEILLSSTIKSDVGSLEGMLLELEFNLNIINSIDTISPTEKIGCSLRIDQHKRSITDGSILLLSNEVRKSVNIAYGFIGKANSHISTLINIRPEGNAYAIAKNNALKSLNECKIEVEKSYGILKKFLDKDKN